MRAGKDAGKSKQAMQSKCSAQIGDIYRGRHRAWILRRSSIEMNKLFAYSRTWLMMLCLVPLPLHALLDQGGRLFLALTAYAKDAQDNAIWHGALGSSDAHIERCHQLVLR